MYDLIGITYLPRELRELGATATYRTIYRMVIDGAIPAETVNGRWFVRRADLQKIASVLHARAPRR